MILFPLDGTEPYAINARNGERQVRGARTWFAKHCLPPDIAFKDAAKRPAVSNKPVDQATVAELAEMLNSEEHPVPEVKADPPQQPAPKAMSKTAKKAAPPAPPVEEPKAADFAGVQGVKDSDVAAAEEWVPYIKSKSERGAPATSSSTRPPAR